MNPTEKIETSAFHIPSLDGFRAVAVMLVFLSHAGLGKFIPGGFGVTIFFFLSGYLITTLLRREYNKTAKINLRNFYIRRMLRIWPNFYLVLILGAALTILKIIPGYIEFAGVAAQSLHFANYYYIYWGGRGTTDGSTVFWSLAVEEHFYLIFPIIYISLLNIRPQLSPPSIFKLLMALCLIILLWRIYLVWFQHVPADRTYYLSDTRFDSLLFGCGLAVFNNPMIDTKEYVHEILLKYFFLPIGISLLLFSFIDRSQFFRDTYRYTIQGIALFPIFIAAIRYPNWWPFRFLNFRFVRFIGVLSYSIYLVNLTVIDVVGHYFSAYSMWLQGVLALILSILIAYAIHTLVEIRLTRLRKQYSGS